MLKYEMFHHFVIKRIDLEIVHVYINSIHLHFRKNILRSYIAHQAIYINLNKVKFVNGFIPKYKVHSLHLICVSIFTLYWLFILYFNWLFVLFLLYYTFSSYIPYSLSLSFSLIRVKLKNEVYLRHIYLCVCMVNKIHIISVMLLYVFLTSVCVCVQGTEKHLMTRAALLNK